MRVDEASFIHVWNHHRQAFVRIMAEATGGRMARSQSVKEQEVIENVEQVQRPQRLLTAYAAWVERIRQRVSQRERVAGFWTMNRDGHMVRQSWQPVDEQVDLDCVSCCV